MRAFLTPHLIKTSIPNFGQYFGKARFQSTTVASTAVVSVLVECAYSNIFQSCLQYIVKSRDPFGYQIVMGSIQAFMPELLCLL